MQDLQQWIGHTELLHAGTHSATVRALSAVLDRDDPQPGPGTPLPWLRLGKVTVITAGRRKWHGRVPKMSAAVERMWGIAPSERLDRLLA